MKKIITIIGMLICFISYGKEQVNFYKQKYYDNVFYYDMIGVGGGFGGGGIAYDGFSSSAYSSNFTIFGAALFINSGTEGGCQGEHRYGKGSVNSTPKLVEMLAGFYFPIYKNNKESIKIYISPLVGTIQKKYQYSDEYYGKAVTARTEGEWDSFGGAIKLYFRCKWIQSGGDVYIQATNHSINFGFGVNLDFKGICDIIRN